MEFIKKIGNAIWDWLESLWDFHKWKLIIGIFLVLALGSQVIQVFVQPTYDYHLCWVVGTKPEVYTEKKPELLELFAPYMEDLTDNGEVETEFLMTDMLLDDTDNAYRETGLTVLRLDYSMGLIPFYIATEDAVRVLKNEEEMIQRQAYTFEFDGETLYILVTIKNQNSKDYYDDHMALLEKMMPILTPVTLVAAANP